jgi:hypothetical protein
MSDIQRWDSVYNPAYGDHVLKEHDAGRFVKHADHVEALRQAELLAEQRGMIMAGRIMAEGLVAMPSYQQGQRDALAAYPGHTQLIADAREQGQRDADETWRKYGPVQKALGDAVQRVDDLYTNSGPDGWNTAISAAIAAIKGDSDE